MKPLKALNRKMLPRHLYYGPQWLVLGVNNICNLHCKMCDVGTQNLGTNFAVNLLGSHPLHMPLDLFQRVVDQAKKYYPNTKLGYAFTEPLVYQHLEESLAYAKAAGLYTAITTNALNLKQKADMLIQQGLKELFISLDGPEEIHNEIRGHKSSYQRALEGIEAILSRSNIPVSVYCVITEWNIGSLRRFAAELQRFPLKQVGFMHTSFVSEPQVAVHNQQFGKHYHATISNVQELNFQAYDLSLLWEELSAISATDYSFPVSFQPLLRSREELEIYYHQPEQKVGTTCLDVFNTIMIKSDGSVIPAHGRCFNLPIGNLYEQDLNAIWNSPVIGELRSTLNRNGGLLPACTRCCSAIRKG